MGFGVVLGLRCTLLGSLRATLPLSHAVSESGVETMQIFHYDGVNGSCHQPTLDNGRTLLVDCGLFQVAEAGPDGGRTEPLEIDFPVRVRSSGASLICS